MNKLLSIGKAVMGNDYVKTFGLGLASTAGVTLAMKLLAEPIGEASAKMTVAMMKVFEKNDLEM